jgi:soluble lytic murein transglycosylase
LRPHNLDVKAGTSAGVAIALALALFVPTPFASDANQGAEGGALQDGAPRLLPTPHPRLPRDLSLLWLVPDSVPDAPPSSRQFATALKLLDKREFTKALAMLTQPAVQGGPLGLYAEFYAGIAERSLGRHADAQRTFRDIQDRRPIGYLSQAAAIAEAESLEAQNDYKGAAAIYERLAALKTTEPDDVLMRLGLAAKAAGDLQRAGEAFARVYFEFPLGELAASAGSEYQQLPNVQPVAKETQRYKLELGRAERLFAARQYPDARAAFERVKPAAEGEERDLVLLRIAESDYFLKKYRPARDGLKPFLEGSSRQAEALYFHALVMRALNDSLTSERTLRRIVEEFPTQSWAEDALNSLATEHVIRDEDAEADQRFRELYSKYPRGRHSERAAWKIGWRSYRERRYADTVRFFEQAAADFPRSDYRPAWLYWAGRAHEALSEKVLADARYMLVTADYLNTYYGRLAVARLEGGRAAPRIMAATAEGTAGTPSLLPPPPNEALIRALLDIDAYDLALDELRYAQRAWGDSPALQATHAWISRRQAQSETGMQRFNLLRGSITIMKRAYPQYMAAGGEELPREVLTAIFPLEYWDLIKKYSTANKLDPYLVAALMAQESTFVRDIRSHAGAYGLMQLMPTTARQYARRFKIRYATSLLTNADANVRIGTAYLADKIREFGDVHLALASYNAGETPVRRWMTERPGLSDREEFIDDMPYPETQNYVKRLLGTAEDYRRLYGGSAN